METASYDASYDGTSAVLAFFGIGFFIFFFIVCFFLIICNWKIYQKAGKPGWACIIPIYSTLVLLEIIGKPWWWLLLFCIPGFGLIWAIWAINLLSKSFGKSEGFTAGLIFLPIIFYPIMAFSTSIQYRGPGGIPTANLNDQIDSIGKPAI